MKSRRTKIWNTEKLLVKFLFFWNIFDIALHIAVDEVEPLRITGNTVALISSVVIGHLAINKNTKAAVAIAAALAVLILNIIWAVDFGSLPPIAAILISGALICLVRITYLSNKPATTNKDE